MNRLLAIVTIASLAAVAGCDATSSINDPSQLTGGGALAAKGGDSGNSDAAHLCQQGGWQNVMGSDGTLFRKSLFTAVFSNGTGTITEPDGLVFPVTSGVQAAIPFPEGGNYVLTVTNSSGSVTQTLVNPTGLAAGLVEGCPPTGLNRRPSKGPGGFSSGS